MSYKSIMNLAALQVYLENAAIIAFDFETAPDALYRDDDREALDAHKAHIAGISFSITESDAVYLPLAHRAGENAADQTAI